MEITALKELLQRELPRLLREDPSLRDYLIELTRTRYADKAETEDRFTAMLEELRRDREEQSKKWEAQERKWEEQNRRWQAQERKWEEQSRRWEAQERKWEEQNRRWEEQQHRWEEQNRKWEEQQRRWEEQQRRWEENSKRFDQVHEEIMAQAKKFDRSIGALGARWGLRSERAFRDALAGILEEHFDVQVINVTEYDDTGEVFGRPDQVELDVIITDGKLIICELKSSLSKADIYLFERKARFYEKRHNRRADQLLAISPMIDPQAAKVAAKLGIKTFADSSEVETLA